MDDQPDDRALKHLADSPLLRLDPEEQAVLADLVKPSSEGRVGRRSLLQAGAALGAGALLGGVGSYAAVGPASAGTSVCDSSTDVNSGWHDVTDYGAVGDGIADNTASIQDALNAADGGGVVFFPPGIYRKTDTLTMAGMTNVVVSGSGMFTSVIEHKGDGAGIALDNASGISFNSLGLLGDRTTSNGSVQTGIRAGAAVSDCRVMNCRIADWNYDGIYGFPENERWWIIGNLVENCGDDGINPGGSGTGLTDAVVAFNEVYDVDSVGIHISVGSTHIVCHGNIVGDCGVGIDQTGSAYANLTNNIIHNSVGDGINDNDVGGAFMAIRGNTIVDAGSNGINILGSGERIVEGNVVENAAGAGIRAQMSTSGSDAQLIGNTINNCAGHGIFAQRANDFQISDNRVSENGSRANIEVRGLTGATVTGNVVHTHTDRGIYIANCDHVTIVANNIRDCTNSISQYRSDNVTTTANNTY